MLSNTLSALENAYYKLNSKLFDDTLPDICITIQHEKKKGKYITLGWFTTNYVWKNSDGIEMFELNITPDCLNSYYIDIIGTLVHEMVHLYCHINGITDCVGKKHNEDFQAECEKVGLICEKEKSVGWGMTTVSPELREHILSLDIDESSFASSCEEIIIPKEPKKKKPKTYYICPQCREKVNSKKNDLAIMCVKCSKQFEFVQEEVEE